MNLSEILRRSVRPILCALIACLVAPRPAHAQAPFNVVHEFPHPGAVAPNAPLLQASDGNFYGPTTDGAGLGTLFKMTPEGDVTVVHFFAGGSGGSNPVGPLVEGAGGVLYGVTADGGDHGVGTFFSITLATTDFHVLHSFDAAVDGARPTGLVQADGFFCGTARAGGASGMGTVFRISQNGDDLHVLRAFEGGSADGATPLTWLLKASDDHLYGTTSAGCVGGVGTIFVVDVLAGSVDVVHHFSGCDANGYGGSPSTPLAEGGDHRLYGSTQRTPACDKGMIFAYALDGSHRTSVVRTLVGDEAEDTATQNADVDGGIFVVLFTGSLLHISPSGDIVELDHEQNSEHVRAYGIPGSDNRLYAAVSLSRRSRILRRRLRRSPSTLPATTSCSWS